MTGRMRVGSVWSEAVRNVASRTTRATLLALVLTFGAGGLAWADVHSYVGVVRDAETYRSSGSAVRTVSTEGREVNGRRCDALAGTAGVVAAGALRPGVALDLLALPGTDLRTWEVTPGVVDLLAAAGASPVAGSAGPGVWLSDDLALALGARPDDELATSGGTVRVAGIYTWPDDGRARDLGYAVLSPVAAAGAFDRCWAQVWPVDEGVAGLLHTALEPAGVAASRTSPLNASLGSSLDGPQLLAARPTRLAPLAAAMLGAALGLLAVRARRLEIASAMHARVPRAHLTWQHVLEAAAWVGAGTALSAALVAHAAIDGNPDPALAAWITGMRTVLAGGAAAILGILAGVVATRESHLFRYFKER